MTLSQRLLAIGLVLPAVLITIAAEALAVDGVVDLTSLDQGMRGHATLRIAVARDGATLGRGGLLPGHFIAPHRQQAVQSAESLMQVRAFA